MKITTLSKLHDSWLAVVECARTTINKEGSKEPSVKWKKKILLAEHSPIRQLMFRWKWEDLKSWVSIHYVRHKFGIEHYVGTQRTDRTGINRDNKPQDSLVSHECLANAQTIINISRKRLCNCASKETREAWELVLKDLKKIEPELVEVCVPECVYRGFCPEIKSCGFAKTPEYFEWLSFYRKTNK